MRILLNCFNLKTGGGLTVATGVLSQLARIDLPHEFLAVAPDIPSYRALPAGPRLSWHLHPTRWAFPLRHVQHYVRSIRRLAL